MDDTETFTSDGALVIDEGNNQKSSAEEITVSEKSLFEDLVVSVSMENVVDIPGDGCQGGEVPLEDQDGFDSTPLCSQMLCVDPYEKKSDENLDERYTTYIFAFFSLLYISTIYI